MMIIRTYSELSKIRSFDERYQYLKLGGKVGSETFGFDRIFNQIFYKSGEWLAIRDDIIIRDNGCDLGVLGYDIMGSIIIHHMNPISLEDIEDHTDWLLNPDFLISTTLLTHNAIHYGSERPLRPELVERRANDTCPWKK